MSSPVLDNAVLRICLFGRPAAYRGDAAVALPEKGFALVALLAFADGNELDRDAARELLWENAPAERRAGNLRQLLLRLGRLDRAASPVSVTPDGRLRLASEDWRIDALDLLKALPAEGDTRTVAVVPLLEGVAMDGEAFEEWLGDARRTANDRCRAILKAALRRCDPGEREGIARKLIDCDPLDESGYRALMSVYAGAGDVQSARRWWLECRHRLNEELGSQPSRETQALASGLGLEATPAAAVAVEETAADPFGVPTVVVLPPTMLPGNELLDRLGFVILEDVTLGLSQFGSFRVIAAYTSWQLGKGQEGPLDLSGGRFDYAVTVAIRSSGEPLGASCRLTKLSTGEVLWTWEFEARMTELRDALGRLVRKTVLSLVAAVERSEGRSSAISQGSSGYRMYLEGKRALGTTGLESLRAARRWFKAALKRSDEFSAASSGLSRTLSMEWLVRGMTGQELLDEALAAAEQAHRHDPQSGRALRELGFTNLYLRRHEESLDYFSNARLLAPHDADLLSDYADALMHDGQPERALEVMRTAKDLNPLAPDHYRWIEASILYRLEDFEGAMRVLAPLSGSPAISRLLAASCAMAGDDAGAREHAERVRESYPDFRVDRIWRILPDRRRADTAQLARGLELAGLD